MKRKSLILFLLFVLFLYPVTVFSGEWTWINPLPQGNSLAGVWGSSGSDVFAVGYATILHYDGSTWSAMEHGAIEYLDDVWGSSGNDVFAVGSGGTILHYDGKTWSSMASGTTAWLFDVWGSSGSDVFAVGQDGTILHYDGNTWSTMASGTTEELYAVWGSSGSDVFAVGDSGTILHYVGEQCPIEELYGKHSEETELMRYLRDYILNQTPEGQELIRLYYEWSPVIVKAMEEDEEFKAQVKEMIDGILLLLEGEVE